MVMWTKVAIGLGSNLSNPAAQLDAACQLLGVSSHVREFQCSRYLHSKPLGPQDQPDFVNAAAVFKTDLSPEDLLQWLQQIETEQGRVKQRHWGERLIDLDILLYGEQQIRLPHLTIPHRCLTERDFVLLPLAEIWPDVVLPGLGSIQVFIRQLESHYVVTPSTEGSL